jgi:hypothetical protein
MKVFDSTHAMDDDNQVTESRKASMYDIKGNYKFIYEMINR